MSKVNIYSTDLMKSIDMNTYIKKMVNFLINSRGSISVSDKILNLINDPSNILLNNIISDMYKKLLNDHKTGIISYIDLSKKQDIPEGFSFSYWNIDVLQLKDTFNKHYSVLKSFPEFNDRIIYNITDIISSNNTKIDSNKLHQTVIRDLLSRSYYNFDKSWLSSSIIYYLTKFYSISLSSSFSRIYNLDYQDQMIIAAVFSIYFTQKCADSSEINPIMNRMDFLTKFINIKDITNYIEEKYKNKELTLSDVADIIKDIMPERLSKINVKSIYSLGRNFNLNQIVALISLEYPPYWCFNILLAMSGVKSNLYHTLKKLNLMNDLVKFSKEISSSNQLIKSIF